MGVSEELRKHLKLGRGVFLTLLFSCCLNAELHIVQTPSPINGLLGKNVTIPCLLDIGKDRELNLSIVGIHWTKSINGSKIDLYKFANLTDAPKKTGFSTNREKLKAGDASLTKQDVQRGDEGEYTCTVFVTPYKATAKIHVRVFAQPEVTLSDHELSVELGSEKSVTCEVRRFYPEAVKVRWVKYSKKSGNSLSLDKGTCLNVAQKNGDGSFNVTSLVTVRPSDLEEGGDTYSCEVTHESSSQVLNDNFTLTVKEPQENNNYIVTIIVSCLSGVLVAAVIRLLALIYYPAPPKVSDITGLDDLVHDKSSVLSCMVSGFKPKTIELQFMLKRKGEDEQPMVSWKYPPPSDQRNDSVGYSAEQGQLLPLQHLQNGLPKEKDTKAIKPIKSVFSYSCLCFTQYFSDKEKDEGAELIIKVIHHALKPPLIIRNPLSIKGDFLKVSPIKAPTYVKEGEEVTLTCEMSRCDSKPLLVTWLKMHLMEDRPTLTILDKGKTFKKRYTHEETEKQEGHIHRSSSSLSFTVHFKEDQGTEYICQVRYPEIGKTKEASHKTFVTMEPVLEPIHSKPAVHYVGQQMELSCPIHSFNPQGLEVQWYKDEELLLSPEHTVSSGEDRLYKTTSVLTYTPRAEDGGKVFKCRVDHQSLTEPKEQKWTLEELRTNDTKK